MPEYLAPGVYIEEVEIGAKPIEGVSTSTAGFLGVTERGPTSPGFVTNFGSFQRKYGGFIKESNLAYAVEGFFKNGGQRCFIGRIIGNGAATASGSLADEEDEDVMDITTVGAGTWGNNVVVIAEDSPLYDSSKNKLFNLKVLYWKADVKVEDDGDDETIVAEKEEAKDPDVVEIYENLSPDETSSDYYEKKINGVSKLITVEKKVDERPNIPAAKPKRLTTILVGGTAGTDVAVGDFKGSDTQGARTGLAAFEEIDEIAILCVPDENKFKTDAEIASLKGDISSHCEKMKDRFAILQAKQNADPVGTLKCPVDSKYAAFYYPWIKVLDPLTNTSKLLPPGGHIAGVYARSDVERGVHKAPANEVVRGVQGLQFPLTKGEQDMLNPKGVNCIRAFKGRGIRVWGARTTSSDPLWKYVNVRRLFLFVEESIEEGTQWVVFEPNNERLWARVNQSVTQFLTRVWKDGALMGLSPDEAFFVKCDRTTMTQDDLDNGRLIMTIGIAPVKPAEFVIFRIAQWTAGASG